MSDDSDREKPRRGDDRPSRRPRKDGARRPKDSRSGRSEHRRDDDSRPHKSGNRRPQRDGEWKPRRDSEWKPKRDGGWKPRGGTRGGGRSDRGGAGRTFTEAERLQHSLRPVREQHNDPEIPADVTAKDLHPGARNELKTLDKELAETVARHLAMVSMLIDHDPELAHQHAISAMRRAGRIPVTRETYAVTSYMTGDYATALRELRTYRRLSGSELQLALMIDCERALGRPEKAIETGRSVDLSTLPTDVRVQVAIAMSGARLDLGQTLQALYELEIPQLNPERAYSWSPELFASYANVLEDLGRHEESRTWRKRAFLAEAALEDHAGGETIEVLEVAEDPLPPETTSTPDQGDKGDEGDQTASTSA